MNVSSIGGISSHTTTVRSDAHDLSKAPQTKENINRAELLGARAALAGLSRVPPYGSSWASVAWDRGYGLALMSGSLPTK